ncbi:MAG: NADPH:quinone reductase [Rhodospirillales bacterium]
MHISAPLQFLTHYNQKKSGGDMRAAWYQRLGPASEVLELGEMPDPTPSSGELLIRLFASGVNPADVKRRAGLGSYSKMEHSRVIPNSDGAGVVVGIGENAQPSWLGRRVWLFNGQRLGRAYGTAAELISLPSKFVTDLPGHISFDEGATLGIPAMTAFHGVFSDGAVKGKTVLVSGGAGAVGWYSVALAAWGGAQVIATVSSPEKAARAMAGGAYATINYKSEDVVSRLNELTDGRGVDRLVSVDFGGDLRWATQVVAMNGSISSYASDTQKHPQIAFQEFASRNIRFIPFILNSLPSHVLDRARWGVNAWLEEQPNLMRPVGGKFVLEEIAASHEAVEAGEKFGTIVVRPGE